MNVVGLVIQEMLCVARHLVTRDDVTRRATTIFARCSRPPPVFFTKNVSKRECVESGQRRMRLLALRALAWACGRLCRINDGQRTAQLDDLPPCRLARLLSSLDCINVLRVTYEKNLSDGGVYRFSSRSASDDWFSRRWWVVGWRIVGVVLHWPPITASHRTNKPLQVLPCSPFA